MSPHEVPSQVAVPLALMGHEPQRVPHEPTLVSGKHWLPHAWKPALHVKPQLTPSHVAVPFGGGLHGVQATLPQLFTSVLTAQPVPQEW